MSRNQTLRAGIVSFLLASVGVLGANAANQAPMVQLNSPQDGQTFLGPTDIPLVAYAQDSEDGYHLKVEFFEGANSLGFGTFVPTLCPAPFCPFFVLLWSKALPGTYSLTAVATDSEGVSTTSDPVAIKIVESQSEPIVTVFASDPTAAEHSLRVDIPPDTATFQVRRSGGDFDNPLTVFYRIGGTAANGVDYDKLSGEVTIPALSPTAEIVVNPIDDDLSEGTETVVVKLQIPDCTAIFPPPPGCYVVGLPSEAVAYLHDNEPANSPPKLEIVKPLTGATFASSSDIELAVRASDPDGWVHSVEFFANGAKIAEQSIEFIQAPPPGQEQIFSSVWSNVATGKYILRAKATDDRGAASWSAPTAIVVGDVPLVPVVSVIATDPFASETVSSSGTNTATFKIFRSGPTNLDLTVFYSSHGTASNGVDYTDIGNSAIIPAGHHAVRVVIVPIDDNLVEGVETVVLELEPDPSLGPVARYQIGWPNKAAAVIADNDLNRGGCLRLADGSFHLCLERPNGFTFRLETSEDLSLWVLVCTNVVTDGALHFVDPEAPMHSRRFYRIVPQSNYVPEE